MASQTIVFQSEEVTTIHKDCITLLIFCRPSFGVNLWRGLTAAMKGSINRNFLGLTAHPVCVCIKLSSCASTEKFKIKEDTNDECEVSVYTDLNIYEQDI